MLDLRALSNPGSPSSTCDCCVLSCPLQHPARKLSRAHLKHVARQIEREDLADGSKWQVKKRLEQVERLIQNANTWAGAQVLIRSKMSLQSIHLPHLIPVVTVSTAIRRPRQAAVNLDGRVDYPANRLLPGRDRKLAQNEGASLFAFVHDEAEPTRQWSDGPDGSQVLGRHVFMHGVRACVFLLVCFF